MEYITKDDLISKFGASWATDEEFQLYTDQVNAWLYGREIPQGLTDPEELNSIRMAAFFLTRAAKEEALYTNTDNIKSQKGSAQQGTSFEIEYVAYKNVENRWVKLANDILIRFTKRSYVFLIDKIN